MPDTREDVRGPYAAGVPLAEATVRLIERMPKAELHLHLDGSLRIDTAIEIARSRGVDAPLTWDGMSGVLVGPPRSADQAAELVEDKAADNVRYVEIRWGPLLHVAGGLPLAEGIDAVIAGAERAGRASGTTVRLICTAIRSHDPAANVGLAEAAARFRERGLTGWDYAGQEARYPDPRVARRAFDAARAGGLRITLHAGEWGGAAQVRRALEMDPERIAHGPGAAEDPELMAELRTRGVCLDLCPTSNAQAMIVPSVAAHPLARLHRAGVPVTLSTDDLTVSDLTLSEEYRNVVERTGLTLPELWAIDRFALDVAFADEATLAPLRAQFGAWGSRIPELTAG